MEENPDGEIRFELEPTPVMSLLITIVHVAYVIVDLGGAVLNALLLAAVVLRSPRNVG